MDRHNFEGKPRPNIASCDNAIVVDRLQGVENSLKRLLSILKLQLVDVEGPVCGLKQIVHKVYTVD